MRCRRGRRRAPRMLLLALAGALTGGPARGDDGSERYMLRAELGAEYDTNAHRTELINMQGPPIVASPLGRGVLTGTFADVLNARQDIALSATTAGKLFTEPEARTENVAVVETGLTWRVRLSERAALGATGNYYEAFQSKVDITQRRDFQSLIPALHLAIRAGDRTEVRLSGGYRWFTYKP